MAEEKDNASFIPPPPQVFMRKVPDDRGGVAGLEFYTVSEADIAKGKVAELRQELTMGGKKDKNHSAKKIALKKIVANMTMSNNDMVALFPDVISCMQIQSLEIKKM